VTVVVQSVAGTFAGGNGSSTATFPSATTAGNVLVVLTGSLSSGTAPYGVNGGGVTTWTKSVTATDSNGGNTLAFFYGTVTSASTTPVTFTSNSSSANATCVAYEVSGWSGATPTFQALSNQATSASANATGSVTANTGDFVVAMASSNDGLNGVSAPFTYLPCPTFYGGQFLAGATAVASTAGPIQATFTDRGGTDSFCSIVTVFPAGSVPSFSIADPTDADTVDSASTAAKPIANDDLFGTPASPTVLQVTAINFVSSVTIPATQAGSVLLIMGINTYGDNQPWAVTAPANAGLLYTDPNNYITGTFDIYEVTPPTGTTTVTINVPSIYGFVIEVANCPNPVLDFISTSGLEVVPFYVTVNGPRQLPAPELCFSFLVNSSTTVPNTPQGWTGYPVDGFDNLLCSQKVLAGTTPTYVPSFPAGNNNVSFQPYLFGIKPGPQIVQYVNGTANQSTVMFSNVTQSGNGLVACVCDSSSTGTGDTAPPVGSGWQLMAGETGAPNNGATVYYVWPNHPGGIQSQTWRLGINGGTQSSVTMAEFSGLPAAIAVDQFVQSPQNQNNQTYTFTGTGIPVGSNELILSGVQSANAGSATTTATPNSLGTDNDNNFFAWGVTGSLAVSQTVTVNSTPSQSSFVVFRTAVESVTP
jgi:hypothetical protein